MKNNDSFTSFLAAAIVLGGFLFLASLFMGEEECSRAGCDNDRASGSSYCYLHEPGRYSWSSSSGSSSKYSSGNSSKSSSVSSVSSSTKKSSSGSSSSWKSYDEGYEAVTEDDDYDWDRYWSDSDYADGVDDAMEDVDW